VILLWLVAAGAAAAALPDLAYGLCRSLVAAVVVVPLTLPRIMIALAVLGLERHRVRDARRRAAAGSSAPTIAVCS
jgi:hypothetical protein